MIEIRNFLEWVGRTKGGKHQFICCGFCGRCLDKPNAFFLCLATAGLWDVAGLGSSFLGLAVFLVTVTLGCWAIWIRGRLAEA